MAGSTIYLFGAPRIEHDGAPVALGRSRALALLAYLCLSRGMQTRDALVGLLWPAFGPEDGRNNLRRELSYLRKALPGGALLADRLAAGLDPDALAGGAVRVDVLDFEDHLFRGGGHGHHAGLCETCAGSLAAAAATYTADFLAGFSLPDSPEFDEWQYHQAEGLRRKLAGALERLAEWHAGRGEHERALEYAGRWVRLDPLHEPAHRALIRLYGASDQPAAARRQFDRLRRTLRDELGVEPEPATVAVMEELRAPVAPRQETPRPAARPAALPANLPADTTPFIGRLDELAHLDHLLRDPAARLVTIAGVGGMGKTRLALAAGRRLARAAADSPFPDGVYFVPLAPLISPTDIAGAIARALGFTPGGEGEASGQVIGYLRSRRVLLLVDNVEHLIDAASLDFFGRLLSEAPGVKLLATSRARLGLRGEHLFALGGLGLRDGADLAAGPPDEGSPDGLPGEDRPGDAVALFVEAARRVRPAFRLDNSNRAAVERICRLVTGMPLGIELAAGWMELLSSAEIVAEIERSLDFLESSDRDAPARQASLKAVFDSSWRLLTPDEQGVLRCLSVFSGSFDRDAAEKVAGAALRTLLSLASKSWLQAAGENRYQIHELLRQYAAAEVVDETLPERHALYFAGRLALLDESMRGRRPAVAFDAVTADLDNVRASMAWLLVHDRFDVLIGRMAVPLFRYLESRFHYYLFEGMIEAAAGRALSLGMAQEHSILTIIRAAFFFNGYPTRFMDYHWVGTYWTGLMEDAVRHIPHAPTEAGFWSILLAWQYGRFVDVGTGVEWLRRFAGSLEGAGRDWDEAFALQSLGRLLSPRPWDAARFGREGEARRCLERALAIFESVGDAREAAITLAFLGFDRQSEGDLVEAARLLEESQERLRALGEGIIASSLNWQLSDIHLKLGEVDAFLSRLHEMADLMIRSGRPNFATASLSRESYEAVRYGDLDVALRLREESLAISHQTGERFNEAWDCWEMGETLRVMGRPDEARHWYEQSHVMFMEMEQDAGTSFYYRGLGDLALAAGEPAAAEANYRAAIEWSERTNHSWQLAYALAGLGKTLSAAGRAAEARAAFARSLRTGHATGDAGGIVTAALTGVATHFARAGDEGRAAELARLVLAHPLSWRETRLAAGELLGIGPDDSLRRPATRPFDLGGTVETLAAELERDAA